MLQIGYASNVDVCHEILLWIESIPGIEYTKAYSKTKSRHSAHQK